MKESFNIVRKAPSSEHGKMCNLIFIKLGIRKFSFQQKIRTWTMGNRLDMDYGKQTIPNILELRKFGENVRIHNYI